MNPILSKNEAEDVLRWANAQNPGPWFMHSRVAAHAAATIAAACGLDEERAYVFGLLHDIGRYEGVRGLHHALAGYQLMLARGYRDVAQICLTHSFPILHIDAFAGKQDCTHPELDFISCFLEQAVLTDYDKLIQLCDAMSLPDGVSLIDTRLMDVTLRHGFNAYTLQKWKAVFALKEYFDQKSGINIYSLFKSELLTRIFS